MEYLRCQSERTRRRIVPRMWLARCGTRTWGRMRKRVLFIISESRSWRCWALQPMKPSRALTFHAAAPKSTQARTRAYHSRGRLGRARGAAVAQVVMLPQMPNEGVGVTRAGRDRDPFQRLK